MKNNNQKNLSKKLAKSISSDSDSYDQNYKIIDEEDSEKYNSASVKVRISYYELK